MNSTPSTVEALLNAHAFNAALREVEATWTSSAESFVLRARALGGLGRFDDAIANAQAAIEQARLAGNVDLVKGIERRLADYQSGRPYLNDDH